MKSNQLDQLIQTKPLAMNLYDKIKARNGEVVIIVGERFQAIVTESSSIEEMDKFSTYINGAS